LHPPDGVGEVEREQHEHDDHECREVDVEPCHRLYLALGTGDFLRFSHSRLHTLRASSYRPSPTFAPQGDKTMAKSKMHAQHYSRPADPCQADLRMTGAAMLSTCTLTQAGFPDASARST